MFTPKLASSKGLLGTAEETIADEAGLSLYSDVTPGESEVERVPIPSPILMPRAGASSEVTVSMRGSFRETAMGGLELDCTLLLSSSAEETSEEREENIALEDHCSLEL